MDRVDLGKGQYCHYCIADIKAERPDLKVVDARKLASARASKGTDDKPTTRMGCKTCNVHVCEKHWEQHGRD